MKGKWSFQQMAWNNWKSTCKLWIWTPNFTPYRKTNTSEWIVDLNERPKIMKLLEENPGINFCDLGLDNDFSDMTPKLHKPPKWRLVKSDQIKMEKKRTNKQKPALQRTPSRKWKVKQHTGRKYLQIMYLIRGFYSDYRENSYNSISKDKLPNLKVGKGFQ